MEKTTYADPQVKELLASKYLPVRVDQDANPDLSSRYGDWGWPATIIFGPDGTEIAKLRGYIEPERMQALLKAIIDDPSPGPSVGEAFEVKPSTSTFLTKAQRAELIKKFDESYEDKLGGWGEIQKYIDADSLDYAMSRAEAGDAVAIKRARQTLDAAIALIDPVWGGVYQYSEGGSWTRLAFREDHVVPGAISAPVQSGLCAVEGPEISCRRAQHRALSGGIPVQSRRRILRQSGCRSQSRHRWT